jgi:hypothetical protein
VKRRTEASGERARRLARMVQLPLPSGVNQIGDVQARSWITGVWKGSVAESVQHTA